MCKNLEILLLAAGEIDLYEERNLFLKVIHFKIKCIERDCFPLVQR